MQTARAWKLVNGLTSQESEIGARSLSRVINLMVAGMLIHKDRATRSEGSR
jgi:hypothetical protein